MAHFIPRTTAKTPRLREAVESALSKSENQLSKEPDCEKEADEAHEAANKDQAEYDKQLLTLSTAVLALSVGFIKNIVPLPTAIWKGTLYVSFALLAGAIILVLFSYQFSILGNQKARSYWVERSAGRIVPFPTRVAAMALLLNRLCGVVFAAGVIATVVFVIANLHKEAKMANRPEYNDMNGGQCIKVPGGSGTEERGSLLKVPAQPAKPSTSHNPTHDEVKK